MSPESERRVDELAKAFLNSITGAKAGENLQAGGLTNAYSATPHCAVRCALFSLASGSLPFGSRMTL